MLASRMIPMLWVRLAVLVGFVVFVAFQNMWWLTALAVVLALITMGQLVGAYRSRAAEESSSPRRR